MFGPATWNSLPVHVRQSQCLVTSKKQLKTYLFTKHLSQSVRERESGGGGGGGGIVRERGERERERDIESLCVCVCVCV